MHLLAVFGRYSGDRKCASPHNATLVGREGQRTFILDLMNQRAGPGAYLVTGHRGAGKSSFIHSCLDVYEKDVFTRYVNGRVGRTFWDRLTLTLLGLLAAGGAAVVYELIVLAVDYVSSKDPPVSSWVFLVPLLLLGGMPIYYGYRVIDTASMTSMLIKGQSDITARWTRQVVTFLIWVVMLVVCLAVLPLGRHAYGLSMLFFAGSVAITLTHLIPPRSASTGDPAPAFGDTRGFVLRLLAFLASGGVVATMWHQHILASSPFDSPQTSADLAIAGLVVGLLVLTLGLLTHALLERARRRTEHRTSWQGMLLLSRLVTAGSLFLVALVVLLLDLKSSSLAALIESRSAHESWQAPALLVVLAIVLVVPSVLRHRRGRAKLPGEREPSPDWARPPAILLFKALVAIAVGLQIVHEPVALLFNYIWERLDIAGPSDPNVLIAAVTAPTPAFSDYLSEHNWGLVLAALLMLIYRTELEWIVVPFHAVRQDAAGRAHDPPLAVAQRVAQHQASRTLFWRVTRQWLPVIVVSVNLGSDKLPYSEVVRSMLLSLRERYAQRFISIRSTLAITFAGVTFVALVVSAKHLGDLLFWSEALRSTANRQDIERGTICESAARMDSEAYRALPSSVRLACGGHNTTPEEQARRSELLQLLYFDLFKVESKPHREKLLLCQALPCNQTGDDSRQITEVYLQAYHLAIFIVLLVVVKLLLWFFPVIPYRRNVALLDSTLDRLTSRRTIASSGIMSRLGEGLNALFGRTNVQSKELDPEDARTVEVSFIAIIDALQSTALAVPWATGRALSLPAPEIVFVFDELDKVGTRFDPIAGRAATHEQARQESDAEHLRAEALSRLLSEMKSLLSSTPARFFFVGGRNLHDEWLADRTARLPLLTSIFRAEVYLPSLLVDYPQAESEVWLTRVRQYVHVQAERAEAEQSRGWLDLHITGLLLQRHAESSLAFAPPLPRDLPPKPFLRIYRDRGGAPLHSGFILDFLAVSGNTPASTEAPAVLEVERDLVQFLAYRSIGNPKRLRELLESLLRPTARLVDVKNAVHVPEPADAGKSTSPSIFNPKRLRELIERLLSATARRVDVKKAVDVPAPTGDCKSIHSLAQDYEHSISLPEPVRYRLQMLSETYSVLAAHFGDRYIHRDDKLTVSLFNLADFLFRFHGRGFSWSNLERVDELVHKHRAHDHRQLLEELVQHWSDRYLHSIPNGQYDYRFRSDIAQEIRYISRHSEDEMAAFNFTLNESEPLKALYRAQLGQMSEERTPDALAALGELYEFDKEFEQARAQYMQAIRLMDQEYERTMGATRKGVEHTPLWAALASAPEGRRDIRNNVTWGISRLRLMLQVGMTFELSHHYERAAIEYRDARTLARAVLRAMVDADGRSFEQFFMSASPRAEPGSDGGSRLHVLKHLSLLFQPFFAEAWLAEKLPPGVDTSVSLVEREIRGLRGMLPFVREASIARMKGPIGVAHANFSLIMAEMHNKAGDVYFFKGRQAIEHFNNDRGSNWHIDKWLEGIENDKGYYRKGTEGYQLRAHDHYAMALHEIRRFVQSRRINSGRKWGLVVNGREPWETIEPGGWPDYVFRLIGGDLCDLAEGTLARTSFLGLLATLQREYEQTAEARANIDTFDRVLRRWFDFGEKDREGDPPEGCGDEELPCGLGKVNAWLGRWERQEAKANDRGREPHGRRFFEVRLQYDTEHNDVQRIMFALLSNSVAAMMFRRAGYREDAARESMQVADAIAQYFWWANCVQMIVTQFRDTGGEWAETAADYWQTVEKVEFWNHLLDLALTSLDNAATWFERSRGAMRPSEHKQSYRLGPELPVHLAVITCSLGLAARPGRWENNSRGKTLCALVQRFVGPLWEQIGGPPEGAPVDGRKLQDSLRDLIRELYLRHPYPMLTRLHALKISIDDRVLCDEQRDQADDIREHAMHLEREAHRFDAPMHFTSFHVGFTLANVSLQMRHAGKVDAAYELGEVALRRLNASEELVTMRRTYYDTIERLFYLYDDFNDRQIHFNHALQMASLEVCLLLKHTLRTMRDPKGPTMRSPSRRSKDRQQQGVREPQRVDGEAERLPQATEALSSS